MLGSERRGSGALQWPPRDSLVKARFTGLQLDSYLNSKVRSSIRRPVVWFVAGFVAGLKQWRHLITSGYEPTKTEVFITFVRPEKKKSSAFPGPTLIWQTSYFRRPAHCMVQCMQGIQREMQKCAHSSKTVVFTRAYPGKNESIDRLGLHVNLFWISALFRKW